ELSDPHGVAECGDGEFLVCESTAGCVARFDMSGRCVDEIDVPGNPRDVALCADGRIVVSHTRPAEPDVYVAHLADAISVFGRSGELVATLLPPGRFVQCAGVAADASGRVLALVGASVAEGLGTGDGPGPFGLIAL